MSHNKWDVTSIRPTEWGRKARKEEDRLRGMRSHARQELAEELKSLQEPIESD